MGNLEHPHASGLETRNELGHESPRCLVQMGAHLIEHDVARPHGKNPRKGNELLLPTGELGGQTVAKLRDAANPQCLVDALEHLGPGEPKVARPKGNLIGYQRAHELVARILPDVAHQTSKARRRSVHAHRARRGHKPSVHKPRERRLARSVGAEKHHALPRRNMKGDVVEDVPPTEVGKAHVVDLDQTSHLLHEKGPGTSPGPFGIACARVATRRPSRPQWSPRREPPRRGPPRRGSPRPWAPRRPWSPWRQERPS